MIDPKDMGERIAFRSTRGEGRFAKPRWTEIAVYYQPRTTTEPAVFRATVSGCSSVEGEETRVTHYQNRTVGALLGNAFGEDRAKWTGPARSVIEQVGGWLHDNHDRLERALPSYSEVQREAAMDAWQSSLTIAESREDAGRAVDSIAAALGLQRAAPRG